ncbi:MAG: glutamate--tRNA ligase [Caldisericia bacterium]|nr:glutamate--tRNA ligase [Caldisericia bacterium]MDD4613905.1 glutamate--tRNA ligase [Caldisericia bacterium]
MSKIRVRFPPSPTGNLHVGNARTALFNYLFCKHNEGTFVFRIEDTDRERSRDEYIQNEIDAMKWMGIQWDEGIEIGGQHGPYKQSERMSLYQEHIQRLLDTQHAYVCFCSAEQVEMDREEARTNSLPPRYSGRCRNLPQSEVKTRIANGEPYVIRFKLPDQNDVQVTDLIRGTKFFPVSSLDDFIIVRTDGMPTYNLAVTVDDALMEITHIIRGEDHFFGNTPRQVLLYEALGYPVPIFAHMPMILGDDKTKLSKRHGAFAITEYGNMGFLPEAFVNYMAFLGWSPKTEEEFFTLDELIQRFEVTNVNTSPAIFDYEKLKWYNAHYLRQKSCEDLFKIAQEDLIAKGFLTNEKDKTFYLQALAHMKDYIVLTTDIVNYIESIDAYNGIQPDRIPEIQTPEMIELLPALIRHFSVDEKWSPDFVLNAIRNAGKESKVKGKHLWMPLRLIMTNEDQGPEIYLVIYLMGKEKVLDILKALLSKI